MTYILQVFVAIVLYICEMYNKMSYIKLHSPFLLSAAARLRAVMFFFLSPLMEMSSSSSSVELKNLFREKCDRILAILTTGEING